MTNAEDLKRLKASEIDGMVVGVDLASAPDNDVMQTWMAVRLPEGKHALDAMVNLVAVRLVSHIECATVPGRGEMPNMAQMDDLTAYFIADDLAVLRGIKAEFGPLNHDAPEWLDDLIAGDWGRTDV